MHIYCASGKAGRHQNKGVLVQKAVLLCRKGLVAEVSKVTSVQRGDWTPHSDPRQVLCRKEKWAQSFGAVGAPLDWGLVWQGDTEAGTAFCHLMARVFLSEHVSKERQAHLDRAIGSIFFLISIEYLLSLFISRSLHYLHYMSIEILQFLWCKQ